MSNNIIFGKTFFSEKFGVFDFKSNALHSKYETNKQKTFLTNDVIWSPSSFITKKGFVNTLQGMIRNTNYETKKTIDSSNRYERYKDDDVVNEMSGVLAHKISLPMKKDSISSSNLFSPNFMIRYAPGHMKDLSEKDVFLNDTNLMHMTYFIIELFQDVNETALYDGG